MCVVCAAFGFAGCVLTLIGSVWFSVWFCLALRLVLFGSVWLCVWFCLVLRLSSTFRGKKNKRWSVSLTELDSETQIDTSISVLLTMVTVPIG